MDKRIDGKSELYCLIGSPVGHSGSPAMHNYSFEKNGLNCVYMAFDVKESQVKEFMDAARLLNIKGFNVTMPCKIEAARLVDELSPAAQIIGAANTVVNENGHLVGHNTDGVGFVYNLKDHGVEVKGKKIVLMGGGGAGTAIFVQLALEGAKEIRVFNRKGSNYNKLEELSGKIKEFVSGVNIQVKDLDDKESLYESVLESDILINATNVGMKPKENISLIEDKSVYHNELVVADIVYNPIETKMMKDAKEAGAKKIIGGKGMLLWQGAEAFKLFTGLEMPVEEYRRDIWKD